jgi:glycosyltransferase involved in cell wall biosynthesis
VYVRHAAPGVPAAHIPMGIPPPDDIDPVAARARLGLPPAATVVAAFGEVHPHKRISVVLDAFAEFHARHPESLLVLVGPESPNYDVAPVLEAHGLEQVVRRPGFVPPDEYRAYMAAADICLNLRYPTAGETSASLLRLLGAGKPVVVTRTAAYAELPDDVCVKVDPDAHERAMLAAALHLLATRPELRSALGARARDYVLAHHRVERAARAYADFLCGLPVH